jgi:hypothetical protein
MSKSKQKTLNGKDAASLKDISMILEKIDGTLNNFRLDLREFLGTKAAVFQGSTQPPGSSVPPPQAEELPPPRDGSAEEALKTMSPLAQEWLVLHPRGWAMKHYTQDHSIWININEELRGRGYTWVKAGKDSHWQ